MKTEHHGAETGNERLFPLAFFQARNVNRPTATVLPPDAFRLGYLPLHKNHFDTTAKVPDYTHTYRPKLRSFDSKYFGAPHQIRDRFSTLKNTHENRF